MEGFLSMKARQGLLSGLLNGIDESWEPESDPLVSGFSARDWAGKQANAAYVRDAFGLEMRDAPLFAVVSRTVHQKGVDLTLDVAHAIVEGGGQLAILGQGESQIEAQVRQLAEQYPGQVGRTSASTRPTRAVCSPAATSCSCRHATSPAA